MDVVSVKAELGDAPITFESGKLAKQANGAVVVRDGEIVEGALPGRAIRAPEK